jgi:hypothetical protein
MFSGLPPKRTSDLGFGKRGLALAERVNAPLIGAPATKINSAVAAGVFCVMAITAQIKVTL